MTTFDTNGGRRAYGVDYVDAWLLPNCPWESVLTPSLLNGLMSRR